MYGRIRGDHSRNVFFPVPLSPPVNPEPLPRLGGDLCCTSVVLFLGDVETDEQCQEAKIRQAYRHKVEARKARYVGRLFVADEQCEQFFTNMFTICEQH